MISNLYNRYYLCSQNNVGDYKCTRFNSLKSIKNMIQVKPPINLSTGDLEDIHANLIMPVYGETATVFPMYGFIPPMLDGLYLTYGIFKLSTVYISK